MRALIPGGSCSEIISGGVSSFFNASSSRGGYLSITLKYYSHLDSLFGSPAMVVHSMGKS